MKNPAETILHADFVRAQEYLSANRHRGGVLPVPGLKFHGYIVSYAMCAGQEFSTLAALSPNGGIDCFLEESDVRADHYDRRRQDFIAALSRLQIEHLDEAAPLFPMWSDNFYHWMFDSLPKVILLERLGFTGSYLVHARHKHVVESLRLLGIEDSRIRASDKVYIIKNAFLTDRVRISDTEVYVLLRNLFLDAVGIEDGKKHCFIRRTGTRKILNEEELLHELAQYDFQILIPETLTLRDQIRFMTNSELTLSPHGANSILSLFQKKHSILLETFGRTYTSHCMYHIVNVLELLYIPFSEHSRHGDAILISRQTKSLDYNVDTTVLRAILDNALRATQLIPGIV